MAERGETPETIDLDDLVVRYLDDALTAEELARLNAKLREDPAQRQRFVEACLHASFIREAATVARAERRPGVRRRLMAGAGALALVAAAIAIVWLPRKRTPPAQTAALAPALPPLDPSDRVAIVSRAEGAVWKPGSLPLETGRVLGRGRVELVSGRARLDFFGGAQMVLTGPAVLDLESPRRGSLVSGSAVARVHEQAVGFVLGAPGAKIFDLGTEFSLSADPAGKSDVRVFRGEVEASVLGADGATLESTIVGAQRRLTIDPRAQAIRDEGAVAAERMALEPPPLLNVPTAYVESVLKSKPLGYWRFERVAGGRIPNEAAQAHALRVIGDVSFAGGPQNHAATFSSEVRNRALESDDFPTIAEGDFSIELWVNPESIREASLASLVVPPFAPQATWMHLALIELRALEGRFSHAPAAVRYLHRWPPGPGGGVNIFSSEPYRPGFWHHLVGVRRDTTMSLYRDGRLVGKVPIPEARKSIPMRLVLGILPTYNPDQRHFVGQLDEVALYDRALSAEEIAAHHRLVSHD